MRRFVFFLLALSGLNIAGIPATAADKTFRLENDSLAIVIDTRTAGLAAIENKLAGETYKADDQGFKIEAGTGSTPGTLGILTPQNVAPGATDLRSNEASLTYTTGPLTLTVTWRLDPGDDFAVKRMKLDYAGPGTFNVSRFEMFDWALSGTGAAPGTAGGNARAARPLSIPYYGFLKPSVLRNLEDGEVNPPSDTSTAFFHRFREGGVFTALSCDFVLMQQDEISGRSRSTYWPGFILPAGQPFLSENGLVGVYHRKGLFHAPTRPTDSLPSFHYPDVDHRLDRGEIDAMSAAVRKFIKPGVYFTLINCWGVGLPRIIESQQDADLFMHGIDTLVKIPEIEGLHFVHSWCGLTREFREKGLAMGLEPNPYARQVFDHARAKGMKLSMFIGSSNNYPLQDEEGNVVQGSPELLSMDAQGNRRPKNIAISRQYSDHIFKTVSGLCEKYPHLKGLTYDFLSMQPDYDTSHGYLAGRASLYPQYALLRETNRRLRERFPDLMLRGQVGWMWLGPWFAETMSLAHNAGDHNCDNHRNFLDFHIDHQFANNIRLSNWFTNNCKMHPRDKMNSNSIHNGSNYRAWDYGAWDYCILSQIATSQVFGMLHDLPDEQNGEVFRKEDGQFFSKWIQWHKAHADYYRRENDLFGEPRLTGVDGYAYGNGKDSIVFLCNPGWQTRRVAVPVNHEIHLPQSPGAWTIKELYPEERYHIGLNDGVFAFGSTFVTDVPPQTVMVFEVKPDDPSRPLLLGAEGQVAAGADGIAVSAVAGPPGVERLIAIRARNSADAPPQVTLDGKPMEVRRSGALLLGKIKFAGEPVQPEVTDWRAERDPKSTMITARFTPPESARAALKAQSLPVSAPYDNKECLDNAGWLGWGRFIIFIPALPNGLDADLLKGAECDRVVAEFTGTATLNGKPVDVRPNILGQTGGRRRWSGYFIDASEAVQFGQANTLDLKLPDISENEFYGLYLPNLARQKTREAAAQAPPEKLALADAPEAADAFIPKPVIQRKGGRYTVYLKLDITARQNTFFNPANIGVEGGTIAKRAALGAEPRWCTDPARATTGEFRLGRGVKTVLLQVEGGDATLLRLGKGESTCDLPLGALLKEWERRGDPYEPRVADLEWEARKANIAISLAAPWDHKRRIE